MDRFERALVVIAALSCAALAVAVWRLRPVNSMSAPPQPVAVRASPSEVMGYVSDFRGSPSASWTLVEFADYQCQPCINAQESLNRALERHKGKLRLAFRQQPLATIHSEATAAARAAEAARLQGKFWAMNDALFALRGELVEARINGLITALRLDRDRFVRDSAGTARSAVERDLADGKRLQVPGTPTFFLCCPDGKTYRLGGLEQLDQLVR